MNSVCDFDLRYVGKKYAYAICEKYTASTPSVSFRILINSHRFILRYVKNNHYSSFQELFPPKFFKKLVTDESEDIDIF